MVNKEWPSWRYGPGGKSNIFNEGGVVPKGWEDHPDKVKEPQGQPAAKSAKKGADKKGEEEQRYRSEVIEFLKAAGQAPAENASIEELEAQMNAVSPEE